MNRVFCAILFSTSFPVIADESPFPEFKAHPDLYANALQIANSEGGKFWVTDQAFIERDGSSKLLFRLSLNGQNFHQCSASGVAQLTQNGIYEFQNGACKLKLTFNARSLTLEDEANGCKAMYCGARAYFKDKVLFRATRE